MNDERTDGSTRITDDGRGALVAVALVPATGVVSVLIAAVMVLLTGQAANVPWLPGAVSLLVLPGAALAAGHRSPAMLGWALSAGAFVALAGYAIPIAITVGSGLVSLQDYALLLALAEGLLGLAASVVAWLLHPMPGFRVAALITGGMCAAGLILYVQPFVPMTVGVDLAQLLGLVGFQAALFLAGYSAMLTYAERRRYAAGGMPLTRPAPQ